MRNLKLIGVWPEASLALTLPQMGRGEESELLLGTTRQIIISVLIGAASLCLQLAIPMIWPSADRRIGIVLFAVAFVGFFAAGVLFWIHTRQLPPLARRWTIVGFGQGWLETRVRNNAGDQLVVACNPGGGADQINIWVNFRERKALRKSDAVELIFGIDGRLFEWDVPDTGEKNIELSGSLWREVEAIKIMIARMREGSLVKVRVPSLNLRAAFTLSGAFDALSDAATLGQTPETDQ